MTNRHIRILAFVAIMLTLFALVVTKGMDGDVEKEQKTVQLEMEQRTTILQQAYYNDRDADDFAHYGTSIRKDGKVNKFEIINAAHVLGEKLVKEADWSPSSALFIGGLGDGAPKNKKDINYYHGYAKNKGGGIYFFQIPTSKVRIYQDSVDSIYLIGAGYSMEENEWDKYDIFNLHIPPDIIIEKANLDALTNIQ